MTTNARVALVFWGLTRSLQYTIESIRTHVFGALARSGVPYDVYVHTYRVRGAYTNAWAHERGVRLDASEYRMLMPHRAHVSDDARVRARLRLRAYRTRGDPWRSRFAALDNYVLAMYSKHRATRMVARALRDTPGIYTHVVFLRPDVRYMTDFNTEWLAACNDNTVCVADFARFGPYKINDRFAVCNTNTYRVYGSMFKRMRADSRHMQLHSETYLGYTLHRHGLRTHKVPFRFNRVRADGRELTDASADARADGQHMTDVQNPPLTENIPHNV